MSQFAASWRLSRQRLLDALTGLNTEQLAWQLHADALPLGQAALHVAGVEVSFSSQLLDLELDDFGAKLKAAATDSVVNDKPFPFADSEITPELVSAAFAYSLKMVEPLMEHPTDAVLRKEIVSALGPVITGEGALARLGFHAAYHQGQAYLISMAPAFPGRP